MALTPEKILLFLGGVAVAGGGTAYVTGVFDPYMTSRSEQAAPASVEPAPKMAALPPKQETSISAPATSERVAAPDEPAEPPLPMKPSAEQPKTESPATEKSTTGTPAAETPAMAAPEVKADPAGPSAPADQIVKPAAVQPPSFDLVRVEPDGSIVIAGKASPKAKVEILSGSRIIGSGEAGEEGDFAIVIDDPLKPGDYQLVLRATGADKLGAMSAETAVVSIPETLDGQVLALVEQPGKASQLITVPKATGKPSVAEGAATPQTAGGTKETQTDESKESGTAGRSGTSQATEVADAKAGQPGPAAHADPALSPDTPPIPDQPGAVVGGEQPSGVQTADTGTTMIRQDDGKSPASNEATAKPQAPPRNVASADPGKSGSPQVAVEAVEIEGRTVFVAGSGTPGSRIRAYANDILLGDDTVSPGGRFLVQAERDLKVGDYIIRIDVLAPDGVKVLSRAAVPFAREAGESIAAVAPPALPENEKTASGSQEDQSALPKTTDGTGKPVDAALSGTQVPSDSTTVTKFDADSANQTAASAAQEPSTPQPATQEPPMVNGGGNAAPAENKDLSSASGEPNADSSSTARSADTADGGMPAEGSIAEPDATSTAQQAASAKQPSPTTRKPAFGESVSSADGKGAAPAGKLAAAGERSKPSELVAPEAKQVAKSLAFESQATADAAVSHTTDQSAPASGAANTSAPALPAVGGESGETKAATADPIPDEVLAPKLQTASGAVIIRRGDTLWRISRRVYGFGTRYSTIYLANQPQIADPNRIWPGQVFAVPHQSTEGESADLDQLGEQSVNPVAN